MQGLLARTEQDPVTVRVAPSLEPFIVRKGSLALDGISLTIAKLEGHVLSVQIVPFTWKHTALAFAKPGDLVNIEADVLGKYVARLLEARTTL